MPFLVNRGPSPMRLKTYGCVYDLPVGKPVKVISDKARRMLIATGISRNTKVEDYSPQEGPTSEELVEQAKLAERAIYEAKLADVEARLTTRDSHIAELRDELRKRPEVPAASPTFVLPPPPPPPAPVVKRGRPAGK